MQEVQIDKATMRAVLVGEGVLMASSNRGMTASSVDLSF